MIVAFEKSFKKDLADITDKKILLSVKNLIIDLESYSSLNEIQNLKRLKSEGKYYRIRVGNYRIGLIVENNKIYLLRILHRKEIYRYFP